jgi:DUF4097 and DUF4098 domain-containing protein YvlB
MERRKWLILLGVGIPIIIIAGLCVITVVSTYVWIENSDTELRFLSIDDAYASVNESQTFRVETTTELVVDADIGDIVVSVGDSDKIQVDMVKSAWASNQEEAQDAAEALEITAIQSGNRLTITFKKSTINVGMVYRGGSDKIDFNIQVPEDTTVILTTSSGDIGVSDILGSATLTSEFGDIDARDLTSSLGIETRNGEVSIRRIHVADGDVEVQTTFGDISAEEIGAEDIVLKSDNGNVRGKHLDASGELRLETQFGEIDFEDIDGDTLKVTSGNGGIELEGGQIDGLLEVQSTFGDISVTGFNAEGFTLQSKNGNITLTNGYGPITIDTEFGTIDVSQAVNAVLDIKSSNGSIDFSGELDTTANHVIESKFGDIDLVIQEDSAFNVSLKTEFGRIDSDFPIMITGEMNEKEWTGSINEGGKELKVSTDNGNITISILVTTE